MRKAKNTLSDPVTAYAKSVLAGKIVAGPHVRYACQRHIDDLKDAGKRGYYFDLEKAHRIIGYFRDVLRLNGGEHEGKPYFLLDWQTFVVGSLFGWVDAEGFRRFRVAYIETAKGSGKSPLAAGIGMYGLTSDDEARAQIYAVATKRDQAMILFRDAVAMVDQSPLLNERIKKSGVGHSTWNLEYDESGGFFRPIASEGGQSGTRPHIGLIDEIHEHKTNEAVEMMRAGTKSRRQALIFMITNSGVDKFGPCWQYHEYAARVSSGELVDDTFFGYVCALDKGDDPFKDESCWEKANPSLLHGIPGKKYIREQVREARGMPSKEALVRRLCFCEWTEVYNPWISYDIWLGAKLDYDWRSLEGRRAWGGLDLGSTTDLNALVLWVEPEEVGSPWQLVTFAWLPDNELSKKEEADRVPYLRWRELGYLETTSGRAISKIAIVKKIALLQSVFDIQSIAYDRWRMEDLLQMAEDEAVPLPDMIPFGQGFKDMSPALDKFEAALLNGEVVHDGNPILTWNVSNAVIASDRAGNRKLDKEKATGRIDLMVAAVMGAGVAIGNQNVGSIDDFISNPISA